MITKHKAEPIHALSVRGEVGQPPCGADPWDGLLLTSTPQDVTCAACVTETAAEKLARKAAAARERLRAAGKLPRDLRDDPMPKPATETIPVAPWQDTDKDEETP